MRSRFFALVGLAALATVLTVAPTAAAQGPERLEMYTLTGAAQKILRATGGVELTGVRYTRRGIRADAVLTRGQRAKLVASGVRYG
jgi:hypothetical protein